jgi:putative PIN family toxin of toxin-antitoxin system
LTDVLHFLRSHTTQVEAAEVPVDACRDPDDLMVLGSAKAAVADYLVTGDEDLLTLQSYQDIPIVTPRQFWERQARSK